MNFRHILPQAFVKGDIIPVKTTEQSHWNTISPQPPHESPAKNFGEALHIALNGVNDKLVESQALTQKMVADPSSVEAHTVMIAAEKARMSLTLTKNITDLAVRAYREMINLR